MFKLFVIITYFYVSLYPNPEKENIGYSLFANLFEEGMRELQQTLNVEFSAV